MENQKTTTYGDLKIRKAELRSQMNDEGDYSNIGEYCQTIQAIKDAELMLLWSITPDEAYGELEKPKTYQKARYAVIAICIAVILVVALSGCNVAREGFHLIGAASQDVGWMATELGNNINTEK